MAFEANCASRTGSLRCSCWSSQCRWSSPTLQTPMWIRLAESRKSRPLWLQCFFSPGSSKKIWPRLKSQPQRGSMTTSQCSGGYSVLYKDMDASHKVAFDGPFSSTFRLMFALPEAQCICHRLPCATSFFIPRSSSCCRNVSEPVWTSGPWHCTHWRFESTKTYGYTIDSNKLMLSLSPDFQNVATSIIGMFEPRMPPWENGKLRTIGQ